MADTNYTRGEMSNRGPFRDIRGFMKVPNKWRAAIIVTACCSRPDIRRGDASETSADNLGRDRDRDRQWAPQFKSTDGFRVIGMSVVSWRRHSRSY